MNNFTGEYRASFFTSWRRNILIFVFTLGCVLPLNSCQNKLADITNLGSGTGEKIYVLGDSITAGFGLNPEQAYPYLLSQKINLPVVNRGVSGDKTTDGLARLSPNNWV